jgi:hypothetical protein
VIQRSEQARRVLELARAEAEGFGHRYLATSRDRAMAVIANAVADALAPLIVRHLDPLQAGAAVAGAGPVALRSGQRWRASSASVPTVFQFLLLAATPSFRSRKALFSLVLP